MAAGSFEKTSWGWQVQQLGQSALEWLELQFSRLQPFAPELSEWKLPPGSPEILLWLLLVISGLCLVLLGEQLWRLLQPLVIRTQQQGKITNAKLPQSFQSQSPHSWLQQARNWQQQGNYREACRSLYMAMLQRLHDGQLIAHQLSRTDGEYLQQVENLSLLSILTQVEPYQTLIQTHERLCFGLTEISAADFEACEHAYQRMEQGLAISQEQP